MQLRVLTFNIQHCRSFLSAEGKIDFPLFAETIRCFDPDVVGLNEVRGEGVSEAFQAQARILAERIGYHYDFAPAIEVPNGGPYGNAILSKSALSGKENIPIPDPIVREKGVYPYESRCVAKAVLPVAGGITLLVTHFGLNPSEAKNAVDTVVSQIKASPFPVILTGDFNLHPNDPLLDPIRVLLRDTADISDSPMLSYPSDHPTEKIDYIFASASLRPVFASVPQMIVSDHRPYLAVFDVSE